MPNRLAGESSPYLLQHAENPVDWRPWGEEALRKARQEDKPIFLSIGYAACHWCHVMAHESFEDPDTAVILNRDFVPIKVDREERPDVDAVYMDSVVAMTGQGGWPLSVFLTPDGKPFFGGTYFPPSRRFQLPSFREVLEAIARSWHEDRERLVTAGQALADQLKAEARSLPAGPSVDGNVVAEALERLLRAYDWTRGGWGQAPKFPQTPVIQFLLERFALGGDRLALDMAAHALRSMARGGIHDQVGGGFHRYSVDAQWTVPHFEKMLYDNALLARAYLSAWRATGETPFREIAELTLAFLRRELQDPRGGFWSSLDADSEGEEGRFYTWTPRELKDVLGEADAEVAQSALGITDSGHVDGRSVPALAAQPHESPAWGAILGRLFQARESRVRPTADDKVVASWNGMALIAWSEAAQAWNRPDDLATAQELGDFLLKQLSPGGSLLRSERKGTAGPPAFLEDHAAVGLGLLSLYQTDFDERWFSAAVRQAEAILERFADSDGVLYDTPIDHEELLTRPRSYQDSPTPSGAAMAVELMLALHSFTGDERFSRLPTVTLSSIQGMASQHPSAFAAGLANLQAWASPARQLALASQADSPGYADLLQVARSRYLPRIAIAAGSPSADHTVPLLRARPLVAGRATAYLCEHFVCRAPVTSPEELAKQMLRSVPTDS